MQTKSLSFGRLMVAVILLGLLGIAVWGAIHFWQQMSGDPMSLPGKIATGVGVVFTLALGAGLMALSFYSARSGHDEAAQYQPNKKKGDA